MNLENFKKGIKNTVKKEEFGYTFNVKDANFTYDEAREVMKNLKFTYKEKDIDSPYRVYYYFNNDNNPHCWMLSKENNSNEYNFRLAV